MTRHYRKKRNVVLKHRDLMATGIALGAGIITILLYATVFGVGFKAGEDIYSDIGSRLRAKTGKQLNLRTYYSISN